MTLVEAHAGAAACQACGLWERRREVVFGEGSPTARLMIVGEGPGDEEDRTGRPFVGRSGAMLDRALAENGLERSEVYICNTVKCRACDWVEGRPMNRPPTPAESAACRGWLLAQILAIAPRVILCVGAPSAKAIISRKFKITQERGQLMASMVGPQAMACLHPAYVMRRSTKTDDGGYSLIVQDIGAAWRAAQAEL